MKRIILILLVSISMNVSRAELFDWDALETKSKDIITLNINFNNKYWDIQGVSIQPNDNHITKITDNLGGLSIVSEQHGYATCLNYNDEYLIIYQSNWGFGYALSKEHYIDLYCPKVDKPFSNGMGLSLGIDKNKVERIIGKKLTGSIAELVFEEDLIIKDVTNWHSVNLKLVFENDFLKGVYFNDHAEPK